MKNSRPFPKPNQQLVPKKGADATDPKTDGKTKPKAQSKDVREDRGTRQMKTSHNSQTFPHRG